MESILVSGSPRADILADKLQRAGLSVRRARRVEPWSGDELVPEQGLDDLSDVHVIICTPHESVTAEILDRAPKLRGIVSTVIGVDMIDVDAAHERGLILANGAVEENFKGLAEATCMLIAALLLDLPGKQAVLRKRRSVPPGTVFGRMVRGKTIGLVGLGRTARHVVTRLTGWEVAFLAYDPYVPRETVPDEVRLVGLGELLESSDVVTIHAVLTDETRHMLGADELSRMRPDSYLVNTARGAVVDQDALQEILATGAIAGAALDVFEQEPLPVDSPLRDLNNVILTPHMIGHSQELLESLPSAALENTLAIMKGHIPPYLASPQSQVGTWLRRLGELDANGI